MNPELWCWEKTRQFIQGRSKFKYGFWCKPYHRAKKSKSHSTIHIDLERCFGAVQVHLQHNKIEEIIQSMVKLKALKIIMNLKYSWKKKNTCVISYFQNRNDIISYFPSSKLGQIIIWIILFVSTKLLMYPQFYCSLNKTFLDANHSQFFDNNLNCVEIAWREWCKKLKTWSVIYRWQIQKSQIMVKLRRSSQIFHTVVIFRHHGEPNMYLHFIR